jgi:hypothetical protein
MLMDDVLRCAGPGCGRPLTRLATGRPALYCSANCRKAGQRERDRIAEAERQRVVQLADANAARARLWRPLEETALEAGELAGAVLDYAAGGNSQDLAVKLAEFRTSARQLETLAAGYRNAVDLAERLTRLPADRRPPPGVAKYDALLSRQPGVP